MSLTSNEDDIAGLSQGAGGAYGFPTVDDAEHRTALFVGEACQHVVDDGLRFLETWVVAGDDDPVAVFHGFLGHQGALAFVTIASCATYGPALSASLKHFIDGGEHVHQRIGGVGIVDDGRHAFAAPDGLEPSVDGLHGTEGNEHLFGLVAQHGGCTIDGQQVAHVESTDELNVHLMIIDVEVHPVETLFQYLGFEVGCRALGICLDRGLGVLHHEGAVLVVGIDDGEGAFGQYVEKALLCVTVGFEGLVIVEVVAGQVGEYSASKC